MKEENQTCEKCGPRAQICTECLEEHLNDSPPWDDFNEWVEAISQDKEWLEAEMRKRR